MMRAIGRVRLLKAFILLAAVFCACVSSAGALESRSYSYDPPFTSTTLNRNVVLASTMGGAGSASAWWFSARGSRSLVATEEAGSGGTQLFRAVEDPEAADIAGTGQYRPSPTGSEYKGFFESQAQAERFAGSMNAQGYAYNTITSGVVPNDLMSELPFTDLVGNEAGRAYLVPNESLSRIFDVQIH